MNRSASLGRDRVLIADRLRCIYFRADFRTPTFRGRSTESVCRKEQYVILSTTKCTNESIHHISIHSGTKSKPLQKLVITKGNLCGVVNDTAFNALSQQSHGRSQTLPPCSPYLAVVTLTGSVLIQQNDCSQSSIDNHNKWIRVLKEEFNFVHSWPVQLHEDSSKAFLCLNRHTLSVISANGYSCIMFSAINDCRFKSQPLVSGYELITVKRTNAGSQSRCVVKASSGIARSFLSSVCPSRPEADYLTIPDATLVPSPNDRTAWTLTDTLTALYNGNFPSPDSLGLSYPCLAQLGLNLSSRYGQPCWRDIAELLGLTQNDADLICRWASSPYNVPRNRPLLLTPANYVIYHWQFACINHGVGDSPPMMPRACTRANLMEILEAIGRHDLVLFIDEWERSRTRV